MTTPDSPVHPQDHFDGGNHHIGKWGGLTKREYLAAQAMSGLLSSNHFLEFSAQRDQGIDESVAEFSLNCADALIAALNAKEQK